MIYDRVLPPLPHTHAEPPRPVLDKRNLKPTGFIILLPIILIVGGLVSAFA